MSYSQFIVDGRAILTVDVGFHVGMLGSMLCGLTRNIDRS